jgi:hypothetical protein
MTKSCATIGTGSTNTWLTREYSLSGTLCAKIRTLPGKAFALHKTPRARAPGLR